GRHACTVPAREFPGDCVRRWHGSVPCPAPSCCRGHPPAPVSGVSRCVPSAAPADPGCQHRGGGLSVPDTGSAARRQSARMVLAWGFLDWFHNAGMVTARSGFFIIASLLSLTNIYCWLFNSLKGICMSDLKVPVTVLGGGSFGTTLANLLAGNDVPTRLWLRDEEQAASMRAKGETSRYLPGVRLDPRLVIPSDAEEALKDAQLVFLAIPSGAFRSVLQQLAPLLSGKGLISTTKGIEQPGFLMMSQIVEQEVPGAPVAVLSGPNLAREMAAGALTATVIASDDPQLNARVQAVLGCPSLRVYASADRYGVELGGALKNVYAIISG